MVKIKKCLEGGRSLGRVFDFEGDFRIWALLLELWRMAGRWKWEAGSSLERGRMFTQLCLSIKISIKIIRHT